MINHQGNVGPKLCYKLEDFVKPLFHEIKAGPQGRIVRRAVTAAGLMCAAIEHLGKVFWLPSQSHGQGFERSAATSALDSVPLDFPHHGHGDMRTLRKLALTPAKLADAITDSSSDRSPVSWIAFRHAFLRAPLPAPRLADHWAIRHQAETNRNHSKSFRNTAGS
jgi:hypothetical protein